MNSPRYARLSELKELRKARRLVVPLPEGRAQMFSGPVDVLGRAFRTGGLPAIFKGAGLTCLREGPANVVYFSTFEHSMRLARASDVGSGQAAPFAAGGIAGVLNWLVVYPIDVLKTRMQTDNLFSPRYQNTLDCLKQTVRNEGLGALWLGIKPCLLRGFVANGAAFWALNLFNSFRQGPGS